MMDTSGTSINSEKAHQLLSRNTALTFVSEKLNIADFDSKFSDNKQALLEEILQSWQDKIPFQTITQMAMDPSTRKAPTMEENVSYILTLEGGRCWTHNTVMHVLLTVLGFQAKLILGSAFNPEACNHALVVVNDLTKPGSTHVVDVGFGTVHPRVLCLDFDDESEAVEDVYMPYKYIRHDGWIVRCHKPRNEAIWRPPGMKTIEGWNLIYYFKLEERVYEDLKLTIGGNVYDDPDNLFNQSIFIMMVPGGCFHLLTNKKIKWEKSPGGEVVVKVMERDEEIIEVITTTFPSLSDEAVRKAVENWRIGRERKSEIKKEDGVV